MSQYRKLDVSRNEIRLLRLIPSSDKESPIICDLVYTSLDQNPPERSYEALSYTWGGFAESRVVVLNNTQSDITDNLHAALVELRLQKEDRYLWVDALCINQSDILERNREVLRMLSIYQNAQQVIVWLGLGILHTGSAVEHLVYLAKKWDERSLSAFIRRVWNWLEDLFLGSTLFLESFTRALWKAQTLRVLFLHSAFCFAWYKFDGEWVLTGTFWLSFLLYKLIPAIAQLFLRFQEEFEVVSSSRLLAKTPKPVVLEGIKDIFESEWFSRVWIIQEIAAASYAVVQCGSHHVPWNSVIAACKQLAHETSSSWTTHPYANTGFQRAFNLISTLSIGNLSDERVREKRSLFYLLSQFNISKATKDHDKVYGLLGLCIEIREECEGVCALQVNYDSDVELAYTQVARYIIETSGNLCILRACIGVPKWTLPTWVPDWSIAVWRLNQGNHGLFQLTGKPDTIPVAVFLESGKRIKVEGFMIGKLEKVIMNTNSGLIPLMRVPMKLFVKPFVSLLLWLIAQPLTFVVLALFARLAGIVDEKLGKELAIFINFVRREVDRNRGQDEGAITFQHDETVTSLQQERLGRWFSTTRVLGLNYLRWPCHTWAREARPGDVVCLLKGTDRPMIMRPGDVDWKLIGPGGYGGLELLLWERAVELYSKTEWPLMSFVIS